MLSCKNCRAEVVLIANDNGEVVECDAKLVTLIMTNGKEIKGRLAHYKSCKAGKRATA